MSDQWVTTAGGRPIKIPHRIQVALTYAPKGLAADTYQWIYATIDEQAQYAADEAVRRLTAEKGEPGELSAADKPASRYIRL